MPQSVRAKRNVFMLELGVKFLINNFIAFLMCATIHG